MADTENGASPEVAKPKTQGPKFPIQIEANGRIFTMQQPASTVEMHYLAADYESLLASMSPAPGQDMPDISQSTSRAVVDFMVRLCEMCLKQDGTPVNFNYDFAPFDQTPRVLMRKLVGFLFGDFLAGTGGEDFRPLVADLLPGTMSDS